MALEEGVHVLSDEFARLLGATDFSDEESILAYGIRLEGMTVREVLSLGIYSPRSWERAQRARSKAEQEGREYDNASYKGGMGNLVEERYFGYDSNSDERPDFPEAGVELKTTCYDVKKNGKASAGERLVISMIPYDRELDAEFDSSHVWAKSKRILLIFYHRDTSLGKYEQVISYVTLFTPPERDLTIIRDDYEKIANLVRAGRADELSEGLTTYLGAATKGASEAKMWVDQFYPRVLEDGTREVRRAKKRAFAFKRQYMDYVLHTYVIPARSRPGRRVDLTSGGALGGEFELGAGSILKTPLRKGETFESRITQIVSRYIGMSDEELCDVFGVEYTQNKSMWVTLTRRILGVTGNHVTEFQRANISMRTIRVEENGRIRESLSFAPFEFEDLLKERGWYESGLYGYLEETRFFFAVFRKRKGHYYLERVRLWNMPERVIEGEARKCWEKTRAVLAEGVRIERRESKSGNVTYVNNLPGQEENSAVHVRPHAKKSAYLLEDGTTVGDIGRDASRLPDGRYMTKQSFWLNNAYLREQVLSD